MAKVRLNPRVRWLAFSCVLASAVTLYSHRAMAGTSRIDGPGMGPMYIECEYLLAGPEEYAGARRWIMDALSKIQGPDDVYRADSPTAEAFLKLGLPERLPRGSKMSIEVPPTEEGEFAVAILDARGRELAKYAFHFPPYLAWKRVSYSHYALDSEEAILNFDLNREDPKNISVGALVGDFAGGRLFLSVRTRQPNLVTVALGIDLRDIRRYRTYSDSHEPRILGGSDEIVYTLVEVIKAHFRVPPSPPRRHGPRRIT